MAKSLRTRLRSIEEAIGICTRSLRMIKRRTSCWTKFGLCPRQNAQMSITKTAWHGSRHGIDAGVDHDNGEEYRQCMTAPERGRMQESHRIGLVEYRMI